MQNESMLVKNDECAVFYDQLLTGIEYMIKTPENVSKVMTNKEEDLNRETKPGESSITINNIETTSADSILQSAPTISMIEECLECTEKNLIKFKLFIENLKAASSMFELKFTVDKISYLIFLNSFFEKCNYNSNIAEAFNFLLGHGVDCKEFEDTAAKLYRIILFQQQTTSISFYELSLISNILKVHYESDAYLKFILSRVTRAFIMEVGRTFVSNKKYALENEFVDKFAMGVEGLINAFNGLISELGVEQADIPRIVFILLIFNLEKQRSVFLELFGNEELFYCTIRALYGGQYFAKKLENFIKTKLFWKFKMEKRNFTIDKLYQTIYKYEYRKIIGCLTLSKKVVKKVDKSISSSSECDEKNMLTTNILHVTPKVNRTRAVSAFSPLSQRIGESTQNRESFDSKRKLKFE